VSAGEQAEVEVPSVLAMDRESALEAIRDAGLNPIVVLASELALEEGDNGGAGIVTQQFPAAGSQYHLGLPVLVYLSLQE
jgi:beta-lactam-binding protein with PASTA domain